MALPNMLHVCVFLAALAAGDCFLPNLMNQPLKFAVSLLDGSEGKQGSTQAATDTEPTGTPTTDTTPTQTASDVTASYGGSPIVLPQIKYVSFGGSKIRGPVVGSWSRHRPSAVAVPAYGAYGRPESSVRDSSEDMVVVVKANSGRHGYKSVTAKPKIRSSHRNVKTVTAHVKQSGSYGQSGIVKDSRERGYTWPRYIIMKDVSYRPRYHQYRRNSFRGTQRYFAAKPVKDCILC